jgi:hypothetical protein
MELKETFIAAEETAHKARKKARSWVRKELVKLYLKSPAKVQFALAKFGVKRAIKRKKEEFKEYLGQESRLN